jgi:FixJ family two-component response regulator
VPRESLAVVVYVVDGDASVREALCRLTASAGYEPRALASIREFVVQPVEPRKGCILLDADQLDGAAAPEPPHGWHDRLPVIVLCSGADARARERARSSGARFLLNKPVDAQALFDAIAWVTEEAD